MFNAIIKTVKWKTIVAENCANKKNKQTLQSYYVLQTIFSKSMQIHVEKLEKEKTKT